MTGRGSRLRTVIWPPVVHLAAAQFSLPLLAAVAASAAALVVAAVRPRMMTRSLYPAAQSPGSAEER
jgi:hypothetical protein